MSDVGADSQVWIRFRRIILSPMDRETISNGDKLNDKIVNTVKTILKQQFPMLLGLHSTVLQERKQSSVKISNQQLQIVHSRGDHWIAASTILSASQKVMVYDSVYVDIDSETEAVILNLFGQATSIHMVCIPKQVDGQDCVFLP